MLYACAQRKCNNFGEFQPRQALIYYYDCYKYCIVENAEWMAIPGFFGYEISSAGQVRNLNSYGGKARILTPTLRFNKYFYVTLKGPDDRRVGIPVDRLMAITYISSNIKKYIRINHIDNIKCNNRLENLMFEVN